MNKFEIIVNAPSGCLAYTVIQDYQHPKELYQMYRKEGGVEAVQGGWSIWYPYHSISAIRLLGTVSPQSQVQPHKVAIPQDFPRPEPPQGGSGVPSWEDVEKAYEDIRQLRKRLADSDQANIKLIADARFASKDTERLNRIFRWAINTSSGDHLLKWLDAEDARQLTTDVYRTLRDRLDIRGL